MSSVRVLTSGIDTLHLFTTAPLRNSRVDELESAKHSATFDEHEYDRKQALIASGLRQGYRAIVGRNV